MKGEPMAGWMGTTLGRWLVHAIGYGAIGVSSMGCDRSCDAYATCPAEKQGTSTGTSGQSGSGGEGGSSAAGGSGGGSGCPDDPAEGDVAAECGIWVSATLGDDGNSGTQARPKKTLSSAVALAQQAGPGRVYACGETYPEAVSLPAGISLFGGFGDCQGAWTYQGIAARAILAPPLPGVAALTLTEGDAMSWVGDLQVEALEAVVPGGSSIAVLAREGARATFRRSVFLAGNGADGLDGDPGNHDGVSAQKGIPGNGGSNACTSASGLGGVAVQLQCGDGSFSTGGQGGDGGELFANDGDDGQQAPDPNAQGYGAGGNGEQGAQALACTAGNGGAEGADGANGTGAVGYGRLTKDGYVGVPGVNGTPGAPGQGGGGGGASFGNALCGAAPHGGAGGGSGGSGGCGGRAGKGGQAGGSSIGIAVLSDDIHLDDVHIETANGGNGGNGGALQSGGQGGLPGLGGDGVVNGVKGACAGGAGGHGGKGGNGGGGHGGHSVLVGVTGKQPTFGDFSSITGKAGKGGLGGDPGVVGTTGEIGVYSNLTTFEK